MITYINTGTSPNAGNGDSLRLAFTKTNNNFREIVNILGTGTSTVSQTVSEKISQALVHNNHVGLSASAGVEAQVIFAVNTAFNQITIGDSLINNLVVNNNTVYVGSNTLTVNTTNLSLNGNTIRAVNQNLNTDDIATFNGIVPNTATADLGSPSAPWRSLYVSTSTIYFGSTALAVDNDTLTINGNPISGGSTGDFLFTGTTIAASTGNSITIQPSNVTWQFDNTGALTFPTGGSIIFDSSATSTITGVTHIVYADGSTQSTAWTGSVNKTIQSVSVATPTDITGDVVFADSNAAGAAVNLVLPAAPADGTVITVKNINAGGNSVFIQTNGVDNMETETGTIGSGVYATISTTGNFITWIYDVSASVYRIIG